MIAASPLLRGGAHSTHNAGCDPRPHPPTSDFPMQPDLKPESDGDSDAASAGQARPEHLTVAIPPPGPEDLDSVAASVSVHESVPAPVFWAGRPNRMAAANWNPWSPLRTAGGASSTRPSPSRAKKLLDRLSLKLSGSGGPPFVSQSVKGRSLHPAASPPGPLSAPATPMGRRRLARSLSAPQSRKRGTSRRGNSSPRAVFRVVSSAALSADDPGGSQSSQNEEGSGQGEEIAEEEAVCRICMGELGEGGDGMKLQCRCKGELALAHRECAIHWFTVKGNRTCDVCLHDVDNLPVTLLRLPPVPSAVPDIPSDSASGRTWAYLAILLVVSILAYCSLLELLLAERGTAGAVVSLPCGILLGLLSSFTASAMANGPRTVFLYAAVQFALVVASVFLFLSLFRLQLMASILLATSAGFGLALCARTVAVRLVRWRRRRQALGLG